VTVGSEGAEGLAAAEKELTEAGFRERFLAVLCDVGILDEVEALWQQSADRFGRIDIWINSVASAHRMVPLWKLEHEEIAGTVDVTLTGTLNGSYVAMRNMIVQGGGHLYNMEEQGLDGSILEGMGVFGAAKAAVHYFSRSLIEEARSTSVKVSTIVPGIVRTDLQGDGDDFRCSGHLQIQANLDGLAQGNHITILDMATVFAQVNGNAVCAGGFAEPCRVQRVGIHRAARLAQGGDMINVNAQFQIVGIHGFMLMVDGSTVHGYMVHS